MDDEKAHPNWYAAFIAALFTAVVLGMLWDDWFFGIAIGAMIGIVVGLTFKTKPRE
ncbi:hypothetical protein [Agrococcus casei]|uniref:Uncharacterized protein n=1 Tax=Agrococcus casei LMG 22410 TaxID=1255656 RepID=A0A1R4F8V0_9MICO|nr:hypothetical protein [Agrococcus casei]SJM52281.1 hypothetical protein CZ674_03105 [Agrococcus casei LMG 22410]